MAVVVAVRLALRACSAGVLVVLAVERSFTASDTRGVKARVVASVDVIVAQVSLRGALAEASGGDGALVNRDAVVWVLGTTGEPGVVVHRDAERLVDHATGDNIGEVFGPAPLHHSVAGLEEYHLARLVVAGRVALLEESGAAGLLAKANDENVVDHDHRVVRTSRGLDAERRGLRIVDALPVRRVEARVQLVQLVGRVLLHALCAVSVALVATVHQDLAVCEVDRSVADARRGNVADGFPEVPLARAQVENWHVVHAREVAVLVAAANQDKRLRKHNLVAVRCVLLAAAGADGSVVVVRNALQTVAQHLLREVRLGRPLVVLVRGAALLVERSRQFPHVDRRVNVLFARMRALDRLVDAAEDDHRRVAVTGEAVCGNCRGGVRVAHRRAAVHRRRHLVPRRVDRAVAPVRVQAPHQRGVLRAVLHRATDEPERVVDLAGVRADVARHGRRGVCSRGALL